MKSDEHKVNRFLIFEQISLLCMLYESANKEDLNIFVCKGKSPNYSMLIKHQDHLSLNDLYKISAWLMQVLLM